MGNAPPTGTATRVPQEDAAALTMRPVADAAISTRWIQQQRATIQVNALNPPSTATLFAILYSEHWIWSPCVVFFQFAIRNLGTNASHAGWLASVVLGCVTRSAALHCPHTGSPLNSPKSARACPQNILQLSADIGTPDRN